MKRKILLPLLASFLFLTSCDKLKEIFNKDNEEETTEVKKTTEKFTVTWHLDDTKTTTTTVNKGSLAIYTSKATPKAKNSDKFVFVGWSSEKPSAEGLGEVEEDIIVDSDIDLYPIFKIKKLNAVWSWSINGQERTLEVKDIDYGSAIEFPKNEAKPTKAADENGTFEFIGWNFNKDATEVLPEIIITENNVRIYPIFKRVFKYCVVSFYNGNTKHGEVDIVYGASLSSGYLKHMTTPTKETDEFYIYTFAGWSSQRLEDDVISDASLLKGILIKGDTSVYAVYTRSQYKFRVYFKDDEGNILYSQNYNKYDTINLPVRLLYKAPNNNRAYSFKGWSFSRTFYEPVSEDMEITQNAELYAYFEEIYVGAKKFRTGYTETKELPLSTFYSNDMYSTGVIDSPTTKKRYMYCAKENSEYNFYKEGYTHLCLVAGSYFNEIGGYGIEDSNDSSMANMFNNLGVNADLRNVFQGPTSADINLTHLYIYGTTFIAPRTLSIPTLRYLEIGKTVSKFCSSSSTSGRVLPSNITIRYYGTISKFESFFSDTNPMTKFFSTTFNLEAEDGNKTYTF